MEKNEILLKFISANSRMIKHIWSCDYYSDEVKFKRALTFRNINSSLFRDLRALRS